MFRIAIVEDQERDARRLSTALDRYMQEKQVQLHYVWFKSATEFLENYRHQYQLVFMDIRMPGGVDGMSAARELRQTDHAVVLVFLTSLAQYAVEGYAVDAADYILKPVTYAALELKMPRILSRCSVEEEEILIQSGGSTTKLQPGEILYIEIYDHHIQYHTTGGIVRAYGTLKEVENALPQGFFRINNQTIVSLRGVRSVSGTETVVADRTFSVSRGRRKEFLAALNGAGMRM